MPQWIRELTVLPCVGEDCGPDVVGVAVASARAWLASNPVGRTPSALSTSPFPGAFDFDFPYPALPQTFYP